MTKIQIDLILLLLTLLGLFVFMKLFGRGEKNDLR